MSPPMVISANKQPAIRQCVQYQQEVPAFSNDTQFIISAKKANSAKNYVVRTKRVVKRRRKNRTSKSNNQQKNSAGIRLNDCEAALNIYSIPKAKNKPRKVAKNIKNLSTSQNVNKPSPVVHCTVRNLIASYTSPKNKNTSNKTKTTQVTTNSAAEKISGSTQCTNTKQTTPIKIKRQSCPQPILRSRSLAGKVTLRKVYYSEAQSHMLAGVPCAPPVSPTNDYLIEIVPSLADIKSQQAIKAKLKNLEIVRQKENEKLKARFLKEEKRRAQKEKEMIKEQRRAEIYALNEVMTQLEKTKFLKFNSEKYNSGTTNISLKA